VRLTCVCNYCRGLKWEDEGSGHMETGVNYIASISNLYYSASPVVGKSDIRVTLVESMEPCLCVQKRFQGEATATLRGGTYQNVAHEPFPENSSNILKL
jgi:hypothetical protein